MQNSILCSMRHILSRSSCIALIAMSAASVSTTTAQAQSVTQVEFDGAKTRVNFSGRLRMLNEKMAGSTCRVSADNDNADARVDLDLTNAEYSLIMKALRESNPAFGIPTPERRPRILDKIWEIEQQWVRVKFAASEIVKDVDTPKYVDVISELTAPDALALSLDKLESEIVARYTNPTELLSGDAFTISLMARQRKIVQEMSKLTCAVATNQPDFGSLEDLETTMGLFDRSLSALENGMPAVGISAPPSPYVAERVTALRAKWADLSERVISSANSAETLQATTDEYDAFAEEIHELVGLYMLSTPGQADIYAVPLKAYAESVLAKWVEAPELIEAIKAQNTEHASLSQDDIDALDLEWRAEAGVDGDKPLIDSVLSKPSSTYLMEQVRKSGGLVSEAFVMDNRGLNVAQNAATSDYWQGDEDKWQNTFGNDSGSIHIGDIEFDDSSSAFQAQVSMPVYDPATGDMIGAITVGVDVQSFL